MTKRIQRTLAFFLVVLLGVFLAACTTQSPVASEPESAAPAEESPAQSAAESEPAESEEPAAEAPAESEEPAAAVDNSDIQITAILISATSTVTSDMGLAMQAYADAQGLNFTLEYYESNVATYISKIENALAAGVDILITQNETSEDAIDALRVACDTEGVVVCNFDVELPDIDYDYCFTADNYELGRAAGAMAAVWANENLVANGIEVVAGMGDYSISPIAHLRYEGMCDALVEGCPEAQIAMTAEMAYMLDGIEAGENFLQAYPNMNIVVGFNDQSVCGVYETFVAAGKENEAIGMFSIDGISEALYNISKGTMYKGLIDQSLETVGEQMIQVCVDKVNGAADDGEKIIYFPRKEVTIDNIDEYTAKFEHLLSE